MRILVHVDLLTMLRHFDGVFVTLAGRGHSVTIASPERGEVPPPESLRRDDRITFVAAPGRRGDRWAESVHELRLLRDYLRYLEPRFKRASKLRTRALRKMLAVMTDEERTHLVARCPQCQERLVDEDVYGMIRGSRAGQAKLARLMSLVEDTVPSDPTIEEFLKAHEPDVVIATPLIKFGSYQADIVKSAKALSIPVVFPVFSWDNLSNKGLIHVHPDYVLVWNERQRTEAVEMHGVPADRVVVTGAPRFDTFFGMTPQTSRAEFCDQHGFDPAKPIVTYLCSSEFVAGRETEFVERWLAEISAEPSLELSNVLIRPHPRQHGQWKKFDARRARTAVSLPQSIQSDRTLFDSLHHSAAAVGLNTSAELEAGIAGRPVLTILAPEFAEGQQGTLHFEYLLKERGGFVEVAPDFETHRQQLARAVEGNYDASGIRRFIEEFLRPRGIDRPVVPIMADAIEGLAASAKKKPGLIFSRA
jgi:hypothetical protein